MASRTDVSGIGEGEEGQGRIGRKRRRKKSRKRWWRGRGSVTDWGRREEVGDLEGGIFFVSKFKKKKTKCGLSVVWVHGAIHVDARSNDPYFFTMSQLSSTEKAC